MQNANQQAGSQSQLPKGTPLLAGCVAIFGSNSLVLAPIAPEVAAALGSTTPTVMMATAGFGLGTALSALLFARHIDRLGAWRVLRIGMVVLAAALALSALAPSAAFLVAAQFLAGLASGVAVPAIYSNAAAIAPPGRESRTIGFVLTGWTLSLVVGVSLSALLADLVHWRAVFAAIGVVAMIAMAVLVSRKFPGVTSSESAPLPTEALKVPGVAPLLLTCGAFMTAFYGIYGFLGDHLHTHLSLPVSMNGLVALTYGVAFGSAASLDGLLDRLGPGRIMTGGFIGMAVVYLLMSVAAGSFTGLLCLVFVWGLVNHVTFNALIRRLTTIDAARRGTIMGLNSAVTYIAVVVGTTGFGEIYSGVGFAASGVAAAVLSLMAAAAGAWPASRAASLHARKTS